MVRFPLIPQNKKFFDLFEEGAENLVETARRFADLVEHYENVEEKVKAITELESKGDNIIHHIMEELHKTFVTPLDREDIALIGETIDDVLDFIEGAAVSMHLYRVNQPTARARELAAIIVRSVEEVERALHLLRHSNRLREILPRCIEINRLENEADDALHAGLAELFDDSTHVFDVIKWREIYQLMESATDRCEDIANALEGVVLKNA